MARTGMNGTGYDPAILRDNARARSFCKNGSRDLDRYLVGNVRDGLFEVVANDQRTIRTDPAARVNNSLREVFTK